MSIQHTIGGQAPYLVLGTLGPGHSVGRRQRNTGHMPSTQSGAWSKPYPILPCNGLTWGIEGEAVHFSPALPHGTSREAAIFIYAIMTWVFYAPKGAVIFSIEKTIDPAVPWLNVFTSDPDDWDAIDALHERLSTAGSSISDVVQDLVDEVRA
jgi:hypothetical protein